MLVWPISSPKMTRMLGLRPDGATGAGAAGAAFWACASAPEFNVAAATSVDVPSRMLRRLNARLSNCFELLASDPLRLASSDILPSSTIKTNDHSPPELLITQRNPRWLVEESTPSAWRAARR